MVPFRLGLRLGRSYHILVMGAVALALVLGIACQGDPTPTPIPTATPQPAPTDTPVPPSPTATVVPVIQPTPTQEPTATPRPSPTEQPTAAPRPTATQEPTATPRPSPTATQVPTPMPTPSPTPIPSLFPLTIVDSNGKEFVFQAPPERIVAFDGAAVEILFAIGQSHRVAGTHDFVDYPPETANIPRVGNAFAVNTEAIIELEPDLIFTFFASSVDALEATGAPVLLIDSLDSGLDDVIEHFRLWGKITDSLNEAEAEIAVMQARLVALAERLEAVEQGPTLYNHVSDFWTPGGDTLHGAIYHFLRVELITMDQSGWAQLSPEQIVIKDPEVIVADVFSVEQLTGNSAFDDVRAVKEGRIIMPEQSFSVAGTRLIAAIEEMAALLYPELFQ